MDIKPPKRRQPIAMPDARLRSPEQPAQAVTVACAVSSDNLLQQGRERHFLAL